MFPWHSPSFRHVGLLLAGLVAALLPGAEVTLQAPLTTLVRCPAPLKGESELSATVTVPTGAPADLGVGVFVADPHGRWFQRPEPGILTPGVHRLRLRLGANEPFVGEPSPTPWTAGDASVMRRTGLYFWSASDGRIRLDVSALALDGADGTTPAPPARLCDLRLDGLGADGAPHGATGERWSLTLRPQPFPRNPYDPDEFALDADITAPDGTVQHVPGFHLQPQRATDRGDREQLVPDGPGAFAVRFRPRQSGRHRLRLRARWGGGATVEAALPDLVVVGSPWDDYVRVDATDPRFFSAGGACFWPLGPNLRSSWDLRCRDRLRTRLTPDRGTLTYDAYLRRLAAHGVNAVEIWMCSWNLALEWRADWPGYCGIGRYGQENAWRLDRILDQAGHLGIRVNLVVNNHGQASSQTDAEWVNNPYNRERGGMLAGPGEFFTDPHALAGQERMRRYLVARYGDHPALLSWKLWSEINLTAGSPSDLKRWHEQAAARWHELDGYGHPVTTHWSGDYHAPDRAIVALPGLDFVCIDAYHGPETLVADLLYNSTMDPNPRRKLALFSKPVMVTEYGGNWDACPEPRLIAEHAIGPWAGLTSGHGGCPMLWWFEWLDQGGHFQPYQALSRFLAGEDLRAPKACSIVLAATTTNPGGELWSRAWERPGRMLGYVLDSAWGRDGTTATKHDAARIQVGDNISAGALTVEWWDADCGERLRTDTFDHPGGPLVLTPPAFQRHLAFKLYRQVVQPSGP